MKRRSKVSKLDNKLYSIMLHSPDGIFNKDHYITPWNFILHNVSFTSFRQYDLDINIGKRLINMPLRFKR